MTMGISSMSTHVGDVAYRCRFCWSRRFEYSALLSKTNNVPKITFCAQQPASDPKNDTQGTKPRVLRNMDETARTSHKRQCAPRMPRLQASRWLDLGPPY